MKIRCSSCEAAVAAVICCADEAALCKSCDEKIHVANKLAEKHQRVPLLLSSDSQLPKCDICQESRGYFFCVEDRALFCRKCDVAIHTSNSIVSGHQRFLMTGVRVGLNPVTSVSTETFAELETAPPNKDNKNSTNSQSNKNNTHVPAVKPSMSDSLEVGNVPNWGFNDLLFDLPDLDQNMMPFTGSYNKGEFNKVLGDDDEWSPPCHAACGEVKGDECMFKVLEIRPRTVSGLVWPVGSSHGNSDQIDDCLFAPDLTAAGSLRSHHQKNNFRRQGIDQFDVKRSRHG